MMVVWIKGLVRVRSLLSAFNDLGVVARASSRMGLSTPEKSPAVMFTEMPVISKRCKGGCDLPRSKSNKGMMLEDETTHKAIKSNNLICETEKNKDIKHILFFLIYSVLFLINLFYTN